MKTLILGAGYAGLAVATKMKPTPGLEAIMLERNPYHTFETRLHEAASDPLPFPLDLDEDSPITINFTSGTTNSPKGVMLTHRNAYMDGVGVLLYMNVTQDSVYLHTLPNFHVNGWGGVWAMQGVGAANVMLPAVRADAIYEAIERHGCIAQAQHAEPGKGGKQRRASPRIERYATHQLSRAIVMK